MKKRFSSFVLLNLWIPKNVFRPAFTTHPVTSCQSIKCEIEAFLMSMILLDLENVSKLLMFPLLVDILHACIRAWHPGWGLWRCWAGDTRVGDHCGHCRSLSEKGGGEDIWWAGCPQHQSPANTARQQWPIQHCSPHNKSACNWENSPQSKSKHFLNNLLPYSKQELLRSLTQTGWLWSAISQFQNRKENLS